MKKFFVVLLVLAAAFIILFFIFGLLSKTGKATGLMDGKLSACPDTPNCVNSESRDDTGHYIEPLTVDKTDANPLATLSAIISGQMGGEIQKEGTDYLAATFSSSFFGFVDDLEVRLDPTNKLLHLRSASRVGYSDADVNLKRVTLLKTLYLQGVKTE